MPVQADIHHILKQYWGYDIFRPLQKEIIQAVLARQDVLALLPTSGGKSICFQLPALTQPGICLVITPLIALMKDQVAQLKQRQIPAAAIFTGMHAHEIDVTLDNAIYGELKLLYISPERLTTELFQARVQKMSINLLAIDEAHCISQWGYDFRPAYLSIAHLRQLVPDVSMIALTATATRAVKQDIQEKLQLRNVAIFQTSFARENIAYAVRRTEDKPRTLRKVLHNLVGSTIIYAGTRKKTQIVAAFLNQHHISATFYHAGLPHAVRAQRQEAWIQNTVRIMVATNAFGMGIDKPDVRLVVHLDLPSTLEAYYQEAGRAGRDGKRAYAIVLYAKRDLNALPARIRNAHPSVTYLKTVYQHLANYYQVAAGTHAMTTYDFDGKDFARVFQLNAVDVYTATKQLERAGIIQLNTAFCQPSQVHITTSRQDLHAFQVTHAAYDSYVQALIRLYGGALWTNFCHISEKQIAQYLNQSVAEVIQKLRALSQLHIIQYIAQNEQPQLTFITPRYTASHLPLDTKKLTERAELAQEKAEAVLHYVTHLNRCRAQILLAYFDEISYQACGACDICLEAPPKDMVTDALYQRCKALVLAQLQVGIGKLCDLIDNIALYEEDIVLYTIRQMLENRELKYDAAYRLVAC